jgi:hypothetical protein
MIRRHLRVVSVASWKKASLPDFLLCKKSRESYILKAYMVHMGERDH